MNRHRKILLKTALITGIGLALAAGSVQAEEERESRFGTEVASLKVENGQVTITGSRISRDVNRVTTGSRLSTASPVTVYTRDDIHRTGATNLPDALRSLDPRVTIQRR